MKRPVCGKEDFLETARLLLCDRSKINKEIYLKNHLLHKNPLFLLAF